MARRGLNREKILLLLLGGLTLSLTRTPKGYFKVLKNIHKAWQKIDSRALKSAIDSLYRSKLLEERNNKDGTITFILSTEGRKTALTYNLENMTVSKHHWDKKWRVVIFDVPEKLKK